MIKKQCNFLKIVKNKRTIGLDGKFNYVFEWCYDDTILIKEVYKISLNEYNLPIENYDLNEMIEHKNHCCLIIDDINIIEEEI